MRVPAHALILVVVPLAFAGCGGTSRHVEVNVSPRSSLADQPLQIAVSNLPSHAVASVEVRSSDAQGTPWRAVARFRADGSGRIDPDRQAPIGGSYAGVWGMGSVASMQPVGPSYGGYSWGTRQMRFRVDVRRSGGVVASTTFTRRLSARPLRTQTLTIAATGLYGTYVAPAEAVKRPAILVLGGSEGGLSTTPLATLLAAHGYPTLALAYFDELGLPASLSHIPLEYFRKALEWLDRQPDVDPSRTLAFGISRGSEAALLLGVHYPQLVHGVIAAVPSNVALCSFPGCAGPVWTLNGNALPFTRQFDDPDPTDDPRAVIPVEKIRGPVFLACGGADLVWTSCPYARAIARRLTTRHVRHPHVLWVGPGAGHGVGFLIPYEPQSRLVAHPWLPADEQAREQVWPRLLRFLRSVG